LCFDLRNISGHVIASADRHFRESDILNDSSAVADADLLADPQPIAMISCGTEEEAKEKENQVGFIAPFAQPNSPTHPPPPCNDRAVGKRRACVNCWVHDGY